MYNYIKSIKALYKTELLKREKETEFYANNFKIV